MATTESTLSTGSEREGSSKRFARIRHFGRVTLGFVAGAAAIVGGGYLGYEFAQHSVAAQSFGEVADAVGVGLLTVGGAALGGFVAIELLPAIAGESPKDQASG